MTKHLTPEEFVDALDGTATSLVESHLAACETCRAELAGMRAIAADVTSTDVPEPSPLFWDHFSARVSQATSAEPQASRPWFLGWRPLGTIGGALAVLGLAFLIAPGTRVPTPEPNVNVATSDMALPVMSDEDGSWGLVVGLAEEADVSVVRQAASPAEGTVDAMIAELTAEQRAALARLLQKEMGDQ